MAKKGLFYIGFSLLSVSGAMVYLSWAGPNSAEVIKAGSTLYETHCASCHGKNLEGETANWRDLKKDGTLPAPPHDASGHTWHHDDQLLFDYTKKGGTVMTPEGFKSAMPGFQDKLRDDEIWAVLSFIKSRWPEDIQNKQALRNEAKK